MCRFTKIIQYIYCVDGFVLVFKHIGLEGDIDKSIDRKVPVHFEMETKQKTKYISIFL